MFTKNSLKFTTFFLKKTISSIIMQVSKSLNSSILHNARKEDLIMSKKKIAFLVIAFSAMVLGACTPNQPSSKQRSIDDSSDIVNPSSIAPSSDSVAPSSNPVGPSSNPISSSQPDVTTYKVTFKN